MKYAKEYQKQADKAIQCANFSGETFHLIEMDFQDTRRAYHCNDDYLNSQEFEAFNGHLIASFNPQK